MSSYGPAVRTLFLRQILRSTLQPVNSLRGERRVQSRNLSATFVASKRDSASGGIILSKRQFSNMPRPIIYYAAPSPPSRAVLLAAAAIGIDIEVRVVDLVGKQNHTEEYKKMNPEHTVPTLDDNGFILWDSHAIMCYFSDKYGKDDSLYPKDIYKRALVNQRLYFESSVLFPRLRFIAYPIIKGLTNEVSSEKLNLLKEAYEHLNNFLEGKKWLVGDSYTLADISCVSSLSSIQCVHPIDEYPNVKAWLKRCEESLPKYDEMNVPGCTLFHKIMAKKMALKEKL